MAQEPSTKELADFMRQEHPEFANEQDDDTLAHFALSEHPALSKVAPKLELPSLGAQAWNATKDTLNGIGETANPIPPGFELPDLIKGPAMAIAHPLDSIGLFSDMMIGHMKDEYAQTQAGMQKVIDDPTLKGKASGAADWAAHGVGMLPMYGPMISGAFEHFKAGETAKGIGNLLGMVAPEIAGRAANRIGPPAPLVEAPVPMSWAERKGGVIRKTMQDYVENTAVGKKTFRPLRVAQQAKLQAMGSQLVDDISHLAGDTPELGKIISDKYDTYAADLKADEDLAKEAGADVPDGIQVPHEKVAAQIIKTALDKNPDTAYKLLYDNKLSTERLGYVKEIVGPEAYRGMTAQLVQDFLKRVTDPAVSEVGTNELRKPSQINRTMLSQLSKSEVGRKLKMVMEPGEYQKLNDIAKLSTSLYVSPQIWVGRLDNVIMRGIIEAGGTALISGSPLEGIVAAAGTEAAHATGLAVAARLMVRPEGATNIREFVRALGRNDIRRIAFYSMRIQDHVEREIKKQYSNAQPLPQTPKQRSLLLPPPG